jgi:hypothetical protein
MHELSMPETLKRREDLRCRSEKDLTVGFYLEWTWTHGCVPRASGSRRKARVVELDDESDVDPPERATCHRGCG